MLLLNRNMAFEFVLRNVVIAAECDLLYFVASSLGDGIYERDSLGLLLECRVHAHIEVAFALKIVNEVAFPLIHQITIDRAFFVDRDQFSFGPFSKERDPREPGSSRTHDHRGAFIHVDCEIRAIGIRMILRWAHLDAACQAILFYQVRLKPVCASLQPLGGVWFARLQRCTGQVGTQRARCLQEALCFLRRRSLHLNTADFCPFS